jgi:indolepyruvate ferredoxin oxidoreductase
MDTQFESYDRLEFHMAPPLFAKRDDKGHLVKNAYGAWMMKVFGLLSRAKMLRGSLLDPFSYTSERKRERQLLKDYQAMLEVIVENLGADNHDAAVALASYPDRIRGYGHVKRLAMDQADHNRRELWAAFVNQGSTMLEAAE